ncbi:MAG: hypothetical protein AAF490_21910 [Chloroflexota bacterium]
MNQRSSQAVMEILHEESPDKVGERFVQIRRWETTVGENAELIVEHGTLNDFGELITQCHVMPFFMTVSEVLMSIGK